MLKNGDTLTLPNLPRKLPGHLAALLCLCAIFSNLLAPSQAALALNDPFLAPLKTLNKIDPANVVQFRLVGLTTTATGASAIVELDTRGGFKVYEKGLRFEYKSNATLNMPIALQATSEPAAKVVQDPFYNEPRGVYEKGARFTARGDVPLEETGVVRIRFEACSVNTCLLPAYFVIRARKGEVSQPEPRASGLAFPAALSSASAPVEVPSTIPSIGSQPELPLVAPISSSFDVSISDTVTAQVQRALSAGSWILFPALFLAGLLMNLTPCVYPMIPITLNVLSQATKHDEKDSAPHPFVPALIYVGGIVLAYAGMGVVAGMTGSLFGGLLQSKIFNIFLAALMFALGLSMLGVIDLSRIQNLGNKIPLSKQSPRLAVLTMGAVSGLVAAPCTGPVLSLLLVLVGQTKDPVYGFTLMSVFAAGFGAPYLLLGLLSQQFTRLPRAGRLMSLVKNLFAALMFALSLYYLKSLLSQISLFALFYAQPSITGVITICVLTLVFMYWQNRSSNHPITVLGVQVGLTLLSLWLTLAAIKGFVPMVAPSWPSLNRIGEPIELPNSDAAKSDRVQWYKDWNKAVQAAQLQKKGLLVDAWAQWCAACLKMDAEVWSESGVEALLNQHFIALKVDFTESNPASEELAKKWDLSGLPAVGIYPAGSDFKNQPPVLFREAVTVSQFHQAVQKLFNGDVTTQERSLNK